MILSFAATCIGSISGCGGGFIIKPVLDATHLMKTPTIGLLSSSTVLVMTIVSLIKNARNPKKAKINVKTSTCLGIGAIFGGIAGKWLFDVVKHSLHNDNMVGMVQSICLFIITLGVFIYVRNKSKVKSLHIEGVVSCLIMGLLLGLIAAFLGIGGGILNVAVLYYFFSMDAKEAAINSLYIILLSQISHIGTMFVTNTVPAFEPLMLILMLVGGVVGGYVGSIFGHKIENNTIEKVFCGVLAAVAVLNLVNIITFAI